MDGASQSTRQDDAVADAAGLLLIALAFLVPRGTNVDNAIGRELVAYKKAVEGRYPEVCICSAQKLDDGRVIRGHRHDDCIQTAIKWKEAGQDIGRPRMELQGFVTSRSRFVDRREAARLMRQVGHLNAMTGRLFDGDYLTSEDLY